MSETIKLKPCPFCGEKAEFFHVYPPFGRRRLSVVQCTHCRCNSGKWGRSDKAIEAWNRRQDESN